MGFLTGDEPAMGGLKRRWDDDVVFKNQSRGEQQQKKRFVNDTIRSDFHKKFLVGILILLDQSKKNHTKSNLMYLCIFMLLSISASRELANALNEPFTQT